MSAAVAKMLAKKYAEKTGKKHFAPAADPYFVTREDGKVTKHKRQDVPMGISPADAKVLLAVRRRAYRLDNSINLCGIRFGLSSVVGLVPALGDFIDVFFALMVYLNCCKVGLDASTKSKMTMNIILDFAVGLTPVLGDIADALFRANTRNLIELEKFLIKKGERNLSKGAGAETSADATPARSSRTEMNEYRRAPPPHYESPHGRRGQQGHAMAEPTRTQTGHSTRSNRDRARGRNERERDLEKGEALPPPQPALIQPRGRNEF
ncbi:MAG: hypothetical protein L6R36_002824 [Xanthoria steineri]|nr:MAG: hypothetical protein L6R36_002824 [Xanthoria steineri]